MLLMKALNASNVGNMATGPKIADLPFCQETTVTSPTLVTSFLGPSYNKPTGIQSNQSVIKY